jgi:hypothetical protein
MKKVNNLLMKKLKKIKKKNHSNHLNNKTKEISKDRKFCQNQLWAELLIQIQFLIIIQPIQEVQLKKIKSFMLIIW